MMNISITLIKQLRDRTGAGIVDCKRALMYAQGNIDKSIDFLRKSGQIKAENKKSSVARSGLIFIKNNNSYGVIIELNCETDFVARDREFLIFGKKIINQAYLKKIDDIQELQNQFENLRVELISKVNENVVISRIKKLEGRTIDSYVHNNRIGVLIQTEFSSKKLAKEIAMHIAASKPDYLRPDLIPKSVMEREYAIQLELAMQARKSEPILEKIVSGRMVKFANEKSLFGQNFIFNPEKTVKQIVLENNINIHKFIRFELGELI